MQRTESTQAHGRNATKLKKKDSWIMDPERNQEGKL